MDKHSSRTEHSDREHGGANANQWQIDRSSEAESPWSLVYSEPFIVAVDAVKSFVNEQSGGLALASIRLGDR